MYGNRIYELKICLFFGARAPHLARAYSLSRFLDYAQQRTTVSTTPLDEWSARHRDFHMQHTTLTTNIHTPGGIRTQISAGERLQTYAKFVILQGLICVWPLRGYLNVFYEGNCPALI